MVVVAAESCRFLLREPLWRSLREIQKTADARRQWVEQGSRIFHRPTSRGKHPGGPQRRRLAQGGGDALPRQASVVGLKAVRIRQVAASLDEIAGKQGQRLPSPLEREANGVKIPDRKIEHSEAEAAPLEQVAGLEYLKSSKWPGKGLHDEAPGDPVGLAAEGYHPLLGMFPSGAGFFPIVFGSLGHLGKRSRQADQSFERGTLGGQ